MGHETAVLAPRVADEAPRLRWSQRPEVAGGEFGGALPGDTVAATADQRDTEYEQKGSRERREHRQPRHQERPHERRAIMPSQSSLAGL